MEQNVSSAPFCQVSQLLIPSEQHTHGSTWVSSKHYLIIQLCNGSTEVHKVWLQVPIYNLLVIDINLKMKGKVNGTIPISAPSLDTS